MAVIAAAITASTSSYTRDGARLTRGGRSLHLSGGD